MFTKLFWMDAVERAVSTFAQALLAVVTADGFDVLQADLKQSLLVAVVAAAASLLKSLVAVKATDHQSASFVVTNGGAKGVVNITKK